MRQLMEDHFVRCDDVKPSLFTPMKVENNEIIDLSEILKMKYNIFRAGKKAWSGLVHYLKK